MKHSFRLFLSIIVIGLISQILQAQAETDTTQFHFPLEVGTIWVYQIKSIYITDECGFGCPNERWEVVERTDSEENGECGRIEAVKIGTSIKSTEFQLCMNNGLLTRYPATQGGFPFENSSLLSSEVMADFTKPLETYWQTSVAAFSDIATVWKKNMAGITDVAGDITVGTFICDSNGMCDTVHGIGYSALDHTYRPYLGFLQHTYWEGHGVKHELRGAVINGTVIGDTTFVYPTSIDRHPDPERSEEPALLGNYPNPFNPTTVVSYRLSVSGEVRISVVNQLGQHVTTLFAGKQAPGQHSVTFDAAGLPSGMYVVVLESEGMRDVRKVTLLK